MKTTVLCATLLCLELVSSYPFPEQLPSYGSDEPVGVPEQGVISQPIQIPNLAHSQNSELAYQQQHLSYLLQEKLRKQNYENVFRNQEQQQVNQRIASQLLIPPQPVTTVREPYINSIPLQSPIQPKYKAPITQQNYQNQQFTEPYQDVKAPQQIQVQHPKTQPVAKPASPAQNYQYNQQLPVPQHKAQNLLFQPRIQQALATTPLKKRYLVLHPNGTVEHIDKIERIVQRYPNYILVNAGDIRKPNVSVTPGPVHPVVPLDSEVVESDKSGPVAPVAPLSPVVPPTLGIQSIVSTIPSPPDTLPPTILNGTVPGPKSTVPPPAGPSTASKSVTAPTTLPPQPLSTTCAPATGTTTLLPPTSTANPTVTPPANSTSTTPPVTENPTTTPSVVIANATVAYPPPSDPRPTTNTDTKVTPPSVVTANATVAYPPPSDPRPTTNTDTKVTIPSVVTANATMAYPPPSDPRPTTNTDTKVTPPSVVTANATVAYPPPSDPRPTTNTDTKVTPPSVVTANATAVYPPTTSTPKVKNPVTAPVANVTAIEADSQSPEATTSTNETSVEDQSDANATITKVAELTIPDLPFDNIPTKPIVWFRSTDVDFFDKLTSGNETFDIVYFFNIPREPRLLKDTKTTIHADGTVVEEITETIYDDEDAPPRVVKTTKVTNPDDSEPKT